jgi:sugar lactone lactonase YvrE
MRCPYCQSIVMLTGNPQSSATPSSAIPDGLGPMIQQAMEMAKASGRVGPQSKIETIRLYRAASGASLADAKKALDSLGSGRPTDYGSRAAGYDPAAQVVKVVANGAKVGAALAIVIFVVVCLIVSSVLHSVRRQMTQASSAIPKINIPSMPLIPQAILAPAASTFAHMVLEFGSEGVGVGRFKDSRSVAVDGQGHVYVGEYSDGRVQVFDPQGQFLAMWSVGKDKSLMNLTAARDGTVYAIMASHIVRYNGSTGMPLGTVETQNGDTDSEEDYMDAYLGPNGNLYAVSVNSDIVILTPDGKIQTIIKAPDKVGEDLHLSRVCALATGEIFALDREKGIFKFAPDGRYVNRFGGGGIDTDSTEPGHLTSPENLAVDSQGRIYVSDMGASGNSIKVFTSDGGYIDSFGGADVVFGLAINFKDEIYACYRNNHTVRKFVLDPPGNK